MPSMIVINGGWMGPQRQSISVKAINYETRELLHFHGRVRDRIEHGFVLFSIFIAPKDIFVAACFIRR